MQATELASPQQPQHKRTREPERRQSISGTAGLDPVNLILDCPVDDDAPTSGGDVAIPVDVRPQASSMTKPCGTRATTSGVWIRPAAAATDVAHQRERTVPGPSKRYRDPIDRVLDQPQEPALDRIPSDTSPASGAIGHASTSAGARTLPSRAHRPLSTSRSAMRRLVLTVRAREHRSASVFVVTVDPLPLNRCPGPLSVARPARERIARRRRPAPPPARAGIVRRPAPPAAARSPRQLRRRRRPARW